MCVRVSALKNIRLFQLLDSTPIKCPYCLKKILRHCSQADVNAVCRLLGNQHSSSAVELLVLSGHGVQDR